MTRAPIFSADQPVSGPCSRRPASAEARPNLCRSLGVITAAAIRSPRTKPTLPVTLPATPSQCSVCRMAIASSTAAASLSSEARCAWEASTSSHSEAASSVLVEALCRSEGHSLPAMGARRAVQPPRRSTPQRARGGTEMPRGAGADTVGLVTHKKI
eukprot:scaffold93687_cov78-Phaeocystis_antarctica.AAC.2